jgi:hypothetical protein
LGVISPPFDGIFTRFKSNALARRIALRMVAGFPVWVIQPTNPKTVTKQRSANFPVTPA